MKFRPGYLALTPLAPLGAAVAHAALTPRKTSAYQPQPDPDRAMAYAEKLSAMIRVRHHVARQRLRAGKV